MPTHRYVLVDVFTEQPLRGNPLAVFTRADRLSPETMQAIAREMNLSETTFISTPREGGHARVRIFTPRTEIPFAGHPVLGTAFVLGGPMQAETVRLETGMGIVPVRLSRSGAVIRFGWMDQPIAEPISPPDTTKLFAGLRIERPNSEVVAYSNGPRHVLVTLPADEVARLRPDMSLLAELGLWTIAAVARTSSNERLKVRVFAPAAGVLEDPATGSAAGPIAVHAYRSGWVAAGTEVVIEQGVEMERDSILHAKVDVSSDGRTIERVSVGGAAVVVGRGELMAG